MPGSVGYRGDYARLGRVDSPSLSIETSAQDFARYPRAAASSSVQRLAPDGRRDRLERRFEERSPIAISDGCYLDSTFFTQGNDPVQPECRSSPPAGRNPQGRRTAAAVLCASLLGLGLSFFAYTPLIPALRLDGSGALFPGYDRLTSVVCSSGNSSKAPETARTDE